MPVKARWWPAVVILGLWAAAITRAWLFQDTIRQFRVLQTVHATVLAVLALLLWLLFASRLPRRIGLRGLGGLVAALAIAGALFRVRGVTGDLVPILEPRWASRADLPRPPELPVEPAAAAAAPAATAPEPAGASARPAESGQPPPPAAAPASPGPAPTPGGSVPPLPSPPAFARLVRDYPQFLGPNRDATLPDLRLARDWSSRPPRRLWRQPIGAGWSAFAVAGGLAVTQEQRGGEELVVAYDLATGRPRWSHADRTRYETVIAGVGPRATPAIAGGRVFALGATGILNALDLVSGRPLWSHRVVEEAGATLPSWGKANSPLVVDGRVIVSAGGPDGRSLVAYDGETGALAWSGGSDRSTYSSPVLATLAGRPQVVAFNRGGVAAHDPGTGAVLWEYPWKLEADVAATPLPLPGDRVLVSAGYGIGSRLLQVEAGEDGGLKARLVWESLRLKSKFANLVAHQGFVYGLDDGVLTCLDPATGERRWKGGRYGHGQIVLAGDLLLVQDEQGELVLVEATPEAHREVARFPVLEGKTWNPPALAGAVLVVRNDREAAAYELPLADVVASGTPGGE